MNILHMVDVPWDSGLAHYALTLASGQQARGHNVWVSTIPGQKPWAKAQRLGVPAVPLATWKSLPNLRRFLIENKIELMNAHTGKTHSLAVMAALTLKVAIIRTRSDARAVRKSFGSGFLFRRTSRVIAAADYVRQDFIRTLGLPSDRVVTIGQGVDTDLYHSAPLPEPPILGIVARLDPVKGHRYLLEALAMLRPQDAVIRLKVIGQSDNIKES
jgi:glycosyltransferase involved in cell wall biosynthesis